MHYEPVDVPRPLQGEFNWQQQVSARRMTEWISHEMQARRLDPNDDVVQLILLRLMESVIEVRGSADPLSVDELEERVLYAVDVLDCDELHNAVSAFGLGAARISCAADETIDKLHRLLTTELVTMLSKVQPARRRRRGHAA